MLPIPNNATIPQLVEAANSLINTVGSAVESVFLPPGTTGTFVPENNSQAFRRVLLVIPGSGGYTAAFQDAAFSVGSLILVRVPQTLSGGPVLVGPDIGTVDGSARATLTAPGASVTLTKRGTGDWTMISATTSLTSSTAPGLVQFPSTISTNTTLPANSNALTVGPLTIQSGVTLTIPEGQRLAIV